MTSLRSLLLLAAFGPALAWHAAAQSISLDGDAPSAAKRQHVQLLSDALETKAGAVQEVELRFRVDPGFHINSHNPKDELLIPTALTLEAAPGVRVLAVEYPAGHPFKLPSSDTALDVYQNEFRVMVRLQATSSGAIPLSGSLRYQACDNAACFPPRSLPVRAMLTAK